MGCSMLGFNEFHKRWKHFLERKTVSLNKYGYWQCLYLFQSLPLFFSFLFLLYLFLFLLYLFLFLSLPLSISSLYMISVDIMSCFDTVLSDHLLVLLRRVLTQVIIIHVNCACCSHDHHITLLDGSIINFN